jgi:hypothetical protein
MCGIVIVDVNNDYCDELLYSYQIIKEENDTYSVYVSRDILRGYYAGKNIESFGEAFRLLGETMEENEGILV